MISRLLRNAAPLCLALAAAACGANQPATESQAPAERPLPQRTAERVEEGERYACPDGGSVAIDADARHATVTREDGARLTLPRAESASKGGGDVFVGETSSAIRESGRVRLQTGSDSVDCIRP